MNITLLTKPGGLLLPGEHIKFRVRPTRSSRPFFVLTNRFLTRQLKFELSANREEVLVTEDGKIVSRKTWQNEQQGTILFFATKDGPQITLKIGNFPWEQLKGTRQWRGQTLSIKNFGNLWPEGEADLPDLSNVMHFQPEKRMIKIGA